MGFWYADSNGLRKLRFWDEGGAEEGKHAVAGDVGERSKLEGVVTTGELEGAGIGAVGVQGVEHLSGELGEKGRIVFSVHHEGSAAGAHTAFDKRHGADGGPVFAEFVHGDVLAEALPNVIGGHALGDHVGEIRGNVEEAAGMHAGVVHEGDVADAGADAGAKNADTLKALLFEPAQAALGVVDGLAIGLKRETDIGADELVGAFVAANHAAVMIRHAHLEGADAEALQPFTKAALAVPFGVPVGEDENGGLLVFRRKKLSMHGVVFRPGRNDGAGEGEDVVIFPRGRKAIDVEAVVRSGSRCVPIVTVLDGASGVAAEELAGIVAVVACAADVFEAPVEGTNHAVVVRGPAAVLVAADSLFEPMHEESDQLSVKSYRFSVYSFGRNK